MPIGTRIRSYSLYGVQHMHSIFFCLTTFFPVYYPCISQLIRFRFLLHLRLRPDALKIWNSLSKKMYVEESKDENEGNCTMIHMCNKHFNKGEFWEKFLWESVILALFCIEKKRKWGILLRCLCEVYIVISGVGPETSILWRRRISMCGPYLVVRRCREYRSAMTEYM